jgi:hypothetical protein
MPNTQNGFTVLVPTSKQLVTITSGKVKFKVRRECSGLLQKLLNFLNTVEPFTEAGWDGGYAYRSIAGSKTWSNHASGTAIDMNASQHPQGKRNAGWSKAQIKEIEWYLANTATGRAVRWGNKFTTTPDGMHFEIKSPSALVLYNKQMAAMRSVK